MRFKSNTVGGVQVFAVSGTNVVSFGIRATAAARKGLLGFAVRRTDVATKESRWVEGYKVFEALMPNPTPHTKVLTVYHPIQSFVWDDFYAVPYATYEYEFHPFRGTPMAPDLTSEPAIIRVRTERHGVGKHDVFFNRGVTGSQSYAINFQNVAPEQQPTEDRRQAAYEWLGRGLGAALIGFIESARSGDAIRGCFYEFTFAGVLDALREAIDRGVDVQLVVDQKVNEHYEKDRRGKRVFVASSPREHNLAAIRRAKLPAAAIIARTKRPDELQHNKFMVLLRGSSQRPAEVWTGSTNLTDGGVYGQANVGHRVRDARVARRFLRYWLLLAADPGGDTSAVKDVANNEFLDAMAELTPVPTSLDDIPAGVTPIFSPRNNLAPLELYRSMLTDAKTMACGTFPFGIARSWRQPLADSGTGRLRFLLLDKRDNPKPLKGETTVVELDWRSNVYKAYGSELETPLGKWIGETNNIAIGLNRWVSYVHLKFLLCDPLGADPIVVTGSANFSDASTRLNDENMLLIRGDRRVADIYFTEFNRLWGHYYYRSVVEQTQRQTARRGTSPRQAQQFLSATASHWQENYAPNKLRQKRVDQYLNMAI